MQGRAIWRFNLLAENKIGGQCYNTCTANTQCSTEIIQESVYGCASMQFGHAICACNVIKTKSLTLQKRLQISTMESMIAGLAFTGCCLSFDSFTCDCSISNARSRSM